MVVYCLDAFFDDVVARMCNNNNNKRISWRFDHPRWDIHYFVTSILPNHSLHLNISFVPFPNSMISKEFDKTFLTVRFVKY